MPLALQAALTALLLCACARGSLDAVRSDEGPAEDELSLVQRDMEVRGLLGRRSAVGSAAGARSPKPAPAAMLQTQRQVREAPLLYVDLDAEPESRWRNVTRHYKDIGAYPGALLLEEPLPQRLRDLVEALKPDEEYLREVRGIVAEIGDPRVTVDGLLAHHLRHEMGSGSEAPSGLAETAAKADFAGLLAAMPNGTVVHGRNVDYTNFEIKLPDGRVFSWPEVTTEVVFLKQGRPLFTSTHWPGQLGVHTAMRFGGWSFGANAGRRGEAFDLLSGLRRGGESLPLRARRIMESVPDFEAAVQEFYNSNVTAPQYFIMAGTKPYEGVVLNVDRGGKHEPGKPLITRLSSEVPSIKGGKSRKRWHLVQTSDDQGSAEPGLRRLVEEDRLMTSPQNAVSAPWVLNEMLTQPILGERTVFTTVYIPQTGYHRTIAHLNNLR